MGYVCYYPLQIQRGVRSLDIRHLVHDSIVWFEVYVGRFAVVLAETRYITKCAVTLFSYKGALKLP